MNYFTDEEVMLRMHRCRLQKGKSYFMRLVGDFASIGSVGCGRKPFRICVATKTMYDAVRAAYEASAAQLGFPADCDEWRQRA